MGLHRLFHLSLLAAGLHAATAGAQAPVLQPVAVASFNMAWAGTLDDFKQHAAVCAAPKVNWCETRARWAPGTTQATPEETARAATCQAAVLEAAGGREAAARLAPCNAYGGVSARGPGGVALDVSALRRPEAYADKLDGLRATVESLIQRDGVRVIAFQEVKSTEAVRAVLGRFNESFEVCAARHEGFQTLAFAWDRTLGKAATCTTQAALAVQDPPPRPAAEPATAPADTRRVRPGLELRLDVNGAAVGFLNLHLKAGCASATSSNPRYPARMITDAVDSCEVLNRQVPLLETWIDAALRRSPRLVVLGDFNRRLDEEQALALPREQVRSDGSNPAGVPVAGPDGRVSTRYLWPELADGTRQLVLLPLKQVDPACKGFAGLDHIVVSGPLQAALAPLAPEQAGARKTAVVSRPGQAMETSDHCPQVARLLL